MPADPDRLYNLLPALYRERDAAEGYPLQALMRLIGQQAGLVEDDIQRLWENLFVETCDTWVIPYIGDLVSNNLLYDSTRLRTPDTAKAIFPDLAGKDLKPPVAARIRADVAKTIYYRRRKGTLPMLEELARDVTGWPAHAVEFFELLGWTQYLEHRRPQSCWADVRSVDRMDRINGAFDEVSHSVDVRQISQSEGHFNIRNIGFFLWRLRSYPLANVPARVASAPWRYHFSPLGNPAPLFSRWRREGDEAGLATELHVAGPIRRVFFYEDLQRYRNLPPPRSDFTQLYGLFEPVQGDPTQRCGDCSFFIRLNNASMTPAQNPNAPPSIFQPRIVCRRLNPWPASRPVGAIIEVDVENGRMAIGDGFASIQSVDVYYHYGFSADLGGGPYERGRWLIQPALATDRFQVKEGAAAPFYPTVTDAINDWITKGRRNAIITILDSRNYALPGSIQLLNDNWLAIEAADGQRPLLQTGAGGLSVDVAPPAPGVTDRNAALTLSGVVVEGFVHVTGDLGRLRVLHSTLVPGRQLKEDGTPASTQPSIVVDEGPPAAPLNTQLHIELCFSITGRIVAPDHAKALVLLDSIVDGTGQMAIDATTPGPDKYGPRLTVERSTILGESRVKMLEASEAIFTGKILVARTQEGCVRFSYVAPVSRTPRRYRCQPDLAEDKAIEAALAHNPSLPKPAQDQIRQFIRQSIVPSFTAILYGRPEYAQLHLTCPVEIRTGAEDASEMGAFSHLKQPQRESNLKIRLAEYLPFGLEAGILYVT